MIHMLEKEMKKIMPPEEGEARVGRRLMKKRLQGLGYIE